MKITSAQFMKGLVGPDEILADGTPQVAFIGRSNVGKSSVINSLTNQKDLARTSSFPGRTQQINVFLINKKYYLIDLPGYGYAKLSKEDREKIQELIFWYLLGSNYFQKKVVLIIDAKVGATEVDLGMLRALEDQDKDIIIVANKIDKLKKADLEKQVKKIETLIPNRKIILYSAEKKIGVSALANEIFG